MGETRKLIMGTFTEDSVTDRAGKAVAATISNTVPGVYVETWPSKGAYMNIEHLFDGTYDLVIVPAGAAYEAYTGTGACEGEKKEKLRAVAACYPIVSTWISPKKLGLSKVQELKGHPLAVENEGSETAKVSGEVFDVLGIDTENTEIWYYGIQGGADGVRDQWADGIHAFTESPVPAYQELAAEDGIRFLSYTDEELDEILDGHPEYSKIKVPAGTYENQDDEVGTFCEKRSLSACLRIWMKTLFMRSPGHWRSTDRCIQPENRLCGRWMTGSSGLLRSRFRFMTGQNGIMRSRDISNSNIFRNCSVGLRIYCADRKKT